ncbi:MAG: hypothetical protein ABDH16_04200 [Thermodesulfovibrionaceae bacterium]
MLEIVTSEKYKEKRGIVLFNNIDLVVFEFFGGDIKREKLDWYSSFSGEKYKSLPHFVKVSFRQNGEKISYIFTVRNNSNIKDIYNEIY